MILITGATGRVGKELISQLLETGQALRVLVRDEHKVANLDRRIERTVGDLNDSASLALAMRDVSKVFLVTFETQHDVNVVEAANRAGIRQIIKLFYPGSYRPQD